MAYTTINKSTDYFNTNLYTGNDTTNNQSVGLTPDLVWVKCRNNAVPSHYWVDKVRGDKKYISSNATTAEQTDSHTFDLVSGGFNLAGGNGWTNVTGRTYASWNWKANGAGSSNTDGSVTSTVSASTTSGFSVVKWTGSGGNATIGHGLGAVPKMIIVKSLANTTSWMVYHSAIGNNSEIYLNGTNAAAGSSTAWQDTDPTSSVFYVAGGAGDGVNASGDYIAYCFAEKKGFSKFGSYTGNGSADGSFIYTGFKPAFLMLKKTSGTGDWFINDVKRNTFNVVNTQLYPNLSVVEENTSATQLDILSNGFKLRGTSANALNSGNDTYIYIAFAEEPLVSSNGVPATAR